MQMYARASRSRPDLSHLSSRPERNDPQRGSFRGVEGPAVSFPMVEIESPWTGRKRQRPGGDDSRAPHVSRVCQPGTRPGATSLALHAPSRSRQFLLPSAATRNNGGIASPHVSNRARRAAPDRFVRCLSRICERVGDGDHRRTLATRVTSGASEKIPSGDDHRIPPFKKRGSGTRNPCRGSQRQA